MRIDVRLVDGKNVEKQSTSYPNACNIDIQCDYRDDLVRAQIIINALLQVLPSEKEPGNTYSETSDR